MVEKFFFYCIFSVIFIVVVILFYRLFLDGFDFIVDSMRSVDVTTRDYAQKMTVDRQLNLPVAAAAISNNAHTSTVTIRGIQWNVEIVDSAMKRSKGLSHRDFLAYDKGMLFVFDSSDYYYFWMKDMRFPLDIIWIRSTGPDTGIVVEADENVQPLSFSTFQRFSPSEPVDLVLEVNAGQYEKFGIKKGSLVTVSRADR